MIETLISFAESWWPLYWVHMLETSLFILVVWAVNRWANLDTRLRYALWLLALVKMFVPPFYAMPLPDFLSDEQQVLIEPANTMPVAFVNLDTFQPPVLALPQEQIFPLEFWFFVAWGLSVCGFVGVTLWRHRVFQRTLGIANPVVLSPDFADLTDGAKVRVYSKANIKSPLLVGVMKPRLYLPANWHAWTPTQLRGVIAHELAHHHNRDLWALAGQVVATVLFGLNPLVWLVNQHLAHLRELRCDEDALKKSGISPVEYGKLLYAFLEANAHPGLPAIGFNEKSTTLKKRFEHVLNFNGGNMKRSKWQMAIPILIALAIIPFSIRETYSQAMSPVSSFTETPRFDKLKSHGMHFAKKEDNAKLELLNITAPNYPQDLAVQGVEGNVEMAVVVGADGTVLEANLIGGDSRFESSARAGLLHARFEPPANGQSVTLRQKVIYRLRTDKGLIVTLHRNFWDSSDMGEIMVWAQPKTGNDSERNVTIKPTKQIPPTYPENLRLNGVEGYVLMNVRINSDGQVSDVYFVEGDLRFEAAAKKALTQFKYAPFSHAELVNKKQIIVFKLARDNGYMYEPSEEINRKSDFGAMVVIAKGPKNDNGFLNQRPSGNPTEIGLNEGRILHSFEVDEKPKRVRTGRMPRSKFAAEARRLGLLNGDLFVKLLVNIDGSVSDVSVLKGNELLHQAVIEDVSQYRFHPAKHQGQVVPVWLTMNFGFNRSDGQTQSSTLAGSEIVADMGGFVIVPKNTDNPKPITVSISFKLADDDAKAKVRKMISFVWETIREELELISPQVWENKQTEKIRDILVKKINESLKGQYVLDAYFSNVTVDGVSTEGEQTASSRASDKILQFFQVDVKPQPITQVAPEYPDIARRAGLTGKVFLKFKVNEDGSVSDVHVLRGQQIFHAPAIEAIEQFRFQPAEHQGRVVAVWMTQPINFQLGKDVPSGDIKTTPSESFLEGKQFKLFSNFPNPFNPETAIKYEVAEPVFVRMEIYNITGQIVRTLVAEDQTPGIYETRWDGKDDDGRAVASGVYYYHVTAGSFNAVQKMQLVK